MNKMFARASAFVVIALTASLAPMASHATTSNCDSKIVVFSSPVGLNSNVAWCAVGADDAGVYDGRLINPGSTSISLRYTADVGADVPELSATLNGLGFTNTIVKLKRTVNATLGLATYDSANVSIPGGRTAAGCVTVSIKVAVDEDPEKNAFHTLGSSC